MKYAVPSFLILLISISTSFSQSSVWMVKNKKATTYIAGSIHMLSETDYPLPNEFDKVYKEAEMLVFETDVIKVSEPEFANKTLSMALYHDDRTLKTVLSENTYEKLKKEASNFGLPLEELIKMKPSFILIMITVLKSQKLGLNQDGVDLHFMKKAIQDSIQIEFFEAPEEQIKMIVDLGEGYEEEYVVRSLSDFENMETEMLQMIKEWRTGSLNVMNKQINKMQKEYPNIYETLQVERNQKWLPKIEEYLATDTKELIIVGAMHLHGTEGLLHQLKQKGYKIKQVK